MLNFKRKEQIMPLTLYGPREEKLYFLIEVLRMTEQIEKKTVVI